jgi:hypothetical protein
MATATTKTTRDQCLSAMQKINQEVTALDNKIAEAEVILRDPDTTDRVLRFETRDELERLQRATAKLALPQMKARKAYERAKLAHNEFKWRTYHQPHIAAAIKAFDTELQAAVDANTKLAHALSEAHNEGHKIPIGVPWPELFRQEDLKNRDSKLEVWQREVKKYGYL